MFLLSKSCLLAFQVESQFLDAARTQTVTDSELQNALGILYNLNRNFDRAVDSIKAAISRNPEVVVLFQLISHI